MVVRVVPLAMVVAMLHLEDRQGHTSAQVMCWHWLWELTYNRTAQHAAQVAAMGRNKRSMQHRLLTWYATSASRSAP